jgi:hypothetical protein
MLVPWLLFHNTPRYPIMMMDNSSFEKVERFKCLEKIPMNQISIQEEIKYRLNSEIACYHVVQNILSSSLLSENYMFACHSVWV